MATATKMTTPEEILAQRAAERSSGRLAHTPNGSGEFYARAGCPCYTCRDALDPTGEEDAKASNEALMQQLCAEANIPPPPPTPELRRQNALCLSCESSHSCEEGCVPATIPLRMCTLARSTGAHEDFYVPPAFALPLPNLPPPPRIITRQPSTASSIMSPLVGIATPRSVSDPSQNIVAKISAKEQNFIKQLTVMLMSYEHLLEHIDMLRSSEGTKHDEMAAYDTWWDEVDEKMAAAQELLDVLKK